MISNVILSSRVLPSIDHASIYAHVHQPVFRSVRTRCASPFMHLRQHKQRNNSDLEDFYCSRGAQYTDISS